MGDSPFSQEQLQWANRHRRDPPPAGPDIHQDWSNVLGGAAGVGKANVFPAKFNFDINAAPKCANDFVVYTTSSAGATSSGAFASRTGTFTANPTAGQTVTITHTGSPPLVLTLSATSNLGLNFLRVAGNTIANATNLANAIARNGGTAGVTATSAGAIVTVTSLTSGTTPNVTLAETLSGFTWAATTLTGGSGTAGQPTIIAFNQLYKGTTAPACGTTATQKVPATFWSYSTGTGAFAETSPVLSLDGTQIAFVQRTAANVANLVLLKWSSTSPGTVGAPTAPTSVAADSYRGCTAPCMTVIAFSGNPNNTNSSPYVDYVGDTLYVGADNGTLHKFTGIFGYNYDVYTGATPAEVTTAPWPVTVSTGNMLTSPVYDANGSGLIFVGSDTGASSGGQLHSIDPTTAAVVSSGQLASYTIVNGGANTTGVRDAPIVDWAAQRVYTFVESDTSQACNTAECKAIYQFPTNSSINGLTAPKVQIGRGQIAARVLYAGTFDDAYYSSANANAASPTGNLYVCGTTSGTTISTQPTLWKIPITNNVMGTPVVGPTLVSGTANCSPITEVPNGANDYIYVSVNALGNKTGCTGSATIGCVYMFNLTGLIWGTGINANAGIQATGGAGGIIIDNVSATTGASQIYYSTLTSPGNAVQASQAALQ